MLICNHPSRNLDQFLIYELLYDIALSPYLIDFVEKAQICSLTLGWIKQDHPITLSKLLIIFLLHVLLLFRFLLRWTFPTEIDIV